MENKNNTDISYKKVTKKDLKQIIETLSNFYPEANCSLNYNTPYELLVALILAAQCTDRRVNIVLPKFMKKFKDVYTVAHSNIDDIIDIIKPCGYYNSKAKSILAASKTIVSDFNGNVPNTMNDLLKLHGIGRKSANIILQECFNKLEGIAVDTHVTRISRKIGISSSPYQASIEKDIMKSIDKKYYDKINHIFVYHGRKICIANHPKCDICPINNLCRKNK